MLMASYRSVLVYESCIDYGHGLPLIITDDPACFDRLSSSALTTEDP